MLVSHNGNIPVSVFRFHQSIATLTTCWNFEIIAPGWKRFDRRKAGQYTQ